jgi:hypothetical protein
VVGFWKKKMGIAFLISAVISMFFTGYILNESKKGKKGSGTLGAIVQLNIKKGDASPEKKYVSYFSTNDIKLTASTMDDNYAMITGILPFRASIMTGGFIMRFEGEKQRKSFSIMDIQRKNGTLEINQLAIPTNTSKQFTTLSTAKQKSEKYSDPELIYSKETLTLNWDVPKGVEFEAAALTLPSGNFLLKRKGNTLVLDMGSKNRASGIIRSLLRYLSRDEKKWTPAVALIKKINKVDIKFSIPAKIQGYNISLYPIKRVCRQQEIFIPAEDIVITPSDKSSRMTFIGNVFKGRPEQPEVKYAFQFTLPAELKDIKPSEVDVKIIYNNVGGNIKLTPSLRQFNQRTGARGSVIKYTTQAGNHYLFKGSAIARTINSNNSFGELLIQSSRKDRTLSFEQGMRANKWSLKGITLTIKGSLPKEKLPLKY